MKKKIRNIVVNNQTYAWNLCKHNGDGDGGIGLRIWQNKQIIFKTFIRAPLASKGITPKLIEKIIKNELTDEEKFYMNDLFQNNTVTNVMKDSYEATCPYCKKTFRYRDSREAVDYYIECLHCGGEIDLLYDGCE